MLARDGLGGALGASLTGVAVTSGPWLLTTLVLVVLRLGGAGAGAEGIVTVVYAVAVVLSAPADIILSRYAADRVYERRLEAIAAPLRRALAALLVVFAVAGAIAMAILRPPLGLALPGVALMVIVGGQWLLLSAASGLSSPGIILRAFALSAPVSIVLALLLAPPLGPAGYLYGFAAGQLVTLGVLLAGTFHALPPVEDETARILPAFRAYWLLAAAAFVFHAGLWIDKIVVFFVEGAPAAARYAALAAVAWLSVVPACAHLFIKMETVFERRFRSFYQGVHAGASLPELERMAAALRAEIIRTLRGTAAVQAGVTAVCLLAAPAVAGWLRAGDAGLLRWLLAGAAAQVLALSATLLLYYFDFRREAFLAALTQLVASAACTLLLGGGRGYALACALTCAVAVPVLLARVGGLVELTFQSQPYASEA